MHDRVVITGIGLVTALGNNVTENLHNLTNAVSGIKQMKFLVSEQKQFPVGEVKLSNQEMCEILDLPYDCHISRTSLLGILALKEALKDSGLLDTKGLGLISGTTVAGMDITEQHYPEPLPPNKPPVHDCCSNTNFIADYFGLFDYTSTISTACSSALNSLILAKMLIENGVKYKVVAGGTEALSKFHLNGFRSLMILDENPCRPFDKTRSGLNLGEGAAYLVLESESSAKERGAKILGVLSGTGNACDAFHQTATSLSGEGAFLAMNKAITSAGITPKDVDYISAHGTGTPDNDSSESAAILRLFGDDYPPISSTKSLTGHTTSASGSIEAAFCLLAINNYFIPQNVGYSAPDENCIVPFVGENTEDLKLNNVMCNAFGFGGNDSSIIISRYE